MMRSMYVARLFVMLPQGRCFDMHDLWEKVIQLADKIDYFKVQLYEL